MSVYWVVLSYGVAVTVALVLLYRFEPVHWIWHILSVCAALGVGLVRLPPTLSSPAATVVVGSLFMFLFTWGAFAPLFRKHHFQHR
jgi:hypothetical protein